MDMSSWVVLGCYFWENYYESETRIIILLWSSSIANICVWSLGHWLNSINGQCRTNPWLAVPHWPWCRNADAGLTQLTNRKNADARLTFFQHSGILVSTYNKRGPLVFPSLVRSARSTSMEVCLRASQCTTDLAMLHPMRWMHPNVLWSTLLSYAARYLATLHTWATLHTAELYAATSY
jgi:hypothetical protein